MFVKKSAEELAQMNEQELAAYLQEEVQAKNAELKTAIEKGLNTQIENLRKDLTELQEARTNAITKSLEKQGLAIEKLMTSPSSNTPASLRTELESQGEVIKSLKNGDSKQNVRFTTKSMTIGANMFDYKQGQVERGVTPLASRRPFMQQLLASGSLTSDKIVWYEQRNRVGDAAVTAEGAAKANIDYEIHEVTALAKKVTAITKVSTEMLADVAFVESEIRNELFNRIALAVDAQLLSGTGAGAQMVGVLQNAVAFAAGSFAAAVDNANEYDVLAIAVTQVMSNNFTPNYILLNPIDIAKMDVTKGSDGQYVLPTFVARDGREVKSTTIVYNNGVPAGTFLVMDSTKATVFTREGLTIDMGYENDDFTKNMVTLRAEWRGLNRIKANEYGAFVKGTFSTAIAAILKP